MKSFFSILGLIIAILVGLALIGLFIENIVQPILNMIALIVVFIIKWALIIGVPIFLVVVLFRWISGDFKASK